MKRFAEAIQFPVRLHMRSDLHLARKIWHMGMGLVICSVYLGFGLSNTTAILILGSVLGLDLLVEASRLRVPAINEKVLRYWGVVMRDCEMERMSGVPHYLFATILAIAVFPKPIAVLSILYLACGDPVASLFGILYGKHGVRLASGKSLVGTTAAIVMCAFLTFVTFKIMPISIVPDSKLLAITLIGGLAGGTAELVPLDMDDNFTIPMVSGFIVWLAFIALGI